MTKNEYLEWLSDEVYRLNGELTAVRMDYDHQLDLLSAAREVLSHGYTPTKFSLDRLSDAVRRTEDTI